MNDAEPIWTDPASKIPFICALTEEALAPIFWKAERLGATSAWWQHVPLGHWLVSVVKPQLLVELGTHTGVSYTAFCQAVVRGGMDTRCYAVDTWAGDPHSGLYGEEIFEEFSRFHNERFSRFSNLLRSSFDDALDFFADGTIDFLHIDGLHTYEAVRYDFENWRPKLSDKAVVVFHDTNVLERDFGVWRLWRELCEQFPSFEFFHGFGLGILAVGGSVSESILELCRLTDTRAIANVRDRFAVLGERWLMESRERALANEIGELKASVVRPLETQVKAAKWAESKFESEIAEARREAFDANLRAEQAIAQARREARDANLLAQQAEAALNGMTSSTSWKLTSPMRAFSRRLPAGFHEASFRIRKLFDVGRKFVYWSVTLQLPSELRKWRAYQRTKKQRTTLPIASNFSNGEMQTKTPMLSPSATREFGQYGKNSRVIFVSGEPGTPGHLYRVVRPAAALGAAAKWINAEAIPDHIPEIEVADVLILWRTIWDKNVALAVGAARRGGAKVIFDVDDLMIDPSLARLDIIDGIRTQNLTEKMVRRHYEGVRSCMAEADMCVGTTDELAAHMRNAGKPTRVIPNGFDHEQLLKSRLAVRRRTQDGGDGLLRIGYAGGSRTHQRDFALCVDAVASVLRTRPDCRLVLFKSADGSVTILDVDEFPSLNGLHAQIEWRNFVPPEELAFELCRFDINLAPLEIGNPFCEAKSELKFFEAALVNVPTIASPCGPFRRAIHHGETGFLATTPNDWDQILKQLVDDASLRERVANAAYRAVLWPYGPERRREMVLSLMDMAKGGIPAARAFERDIRCDTDNRPKVVNIPDHELLFHADQMGMAEVTVVIPLYNYSKYLVEALESVEAQSLSVIDLIIVDDSSTDDSLAIALNWARANARKFNQISVIQNRANVGLALTRNVAFNAADTPWVLPLDADNRLLPKCAAECLRIALESGAAFAYPTIRQFGDEMNSMGTDPYDPVRLSNGNYIDAMALISRAAWAKVGGYVHIAGGWEDFDFWCSLAESGLRGEQVPGKPLAEYRVHGKSMIRTAISDHARFRDMTAALKRRHPWLTLAVPLPESPHSSVDGDVSKNPPKDRLECLLPILRCPKTGTMLSMAADGKALTSEDGTHSWPLVHGRPLLFPGMDRPKINPDEQISNPLPASALSMIENARGNGWVLHLSAGGSAERFDHVIEVEAAVFRHTDLIGDSHYLPFADESFEAVLALNAFEHYRNPSHVAGEILRVLKPGGRVLIRTAFLQPEHEAPWHFYNCTKFGLEAWFENFETERLHVSDNFHPGHSIAWLTSMSETALRESLGPKAADRFLRSPIAGFVSLWRMPEDKRASEIWSDFASLPQDAQEKISAGFEYIGRRPQILLSAAKGTDPTP